MKKLLSVLFVFGILALAYFANAQNINPYQALQPFKNNYRARNVVSQNLKNISGSSFALLMNETSGNLVDAITGTVTIIPNNAASTYNVAGPEGYTPGIQFAAANGGFRSASAGTIAGLGFGTGDGNIFIVMRVDGTPSSIAEIFITSQRGVGNAGFSTRVTSALDQISIQFVATDFTTVTINWEGANVVSALQDAQFHTWEWRIDRTLAVVTLRLDGNLETSATSNSIASLAGKSLNMSASDGIGLGSDYRSGIDVDVPITVSFVRVKQTL